MPALKRPCQAFNLFWTGYQNEILFSLFSKKVSHYSSIRTARQNCRLTSAIKIKLRLKANIILTYEVIMFWLYYYKYILTDFARVNQETTFISVLLYLIFTTKVWWPSRLVLRKTQTGLFINWRISQKYIFRRHTRKLQSHTVSKFLRELLVRISLEMLQTNSSDRRLSVISFRVQPHNV